MTPSDPIACYQAIGGALAGTAPNSWKRLILDAALDGERVDVVVSCWLDLDGKEVEYLTGIPRLARMIYDLARVVSSEEKGYFKRFKLTFAIDGKINVDYAY